MEDEMQNPKYPEKKYSGVSVSEFIKEQKTPLTEAQIKALERMREQGKLY